ncbi:MAG: AAA family ATPase [Candidatus Paceibacterota bacterium]
MANYHIEGLPGTGKTTVGEDLESKGHEVIHADKFGYYGDPKTGLPTEEKLQINWIWDKEKLTKILSEEVSHARFVCGGSMNQDDFKECFKKTFTLYVDDNTLQERLLTRENNDFGKDPEDLARQLEWNKGVDKYIREKGTVPIDATQPLDKVVDEILKHVEEEKVKK